MKYLKLCLSLTFLIMSANTQAQQNQEQLFLVGTYTEESSQGVNLVSFDPTSKKLKLESVNGNIENPSFVIANDGNTLAFAVEEDNGDRGGKVTSYKIDQDSRKLTKINSVYTEGNGPCYLTLDPTEEFILVGNYGGGNLSVIPVQSDGKLMTAIQSKQHSGSSVDEERQNEPHVHSTVFHPKLQQVFVADLGTDYVNIYDFNPGSNSPLTPSQTSSFKVEPGSGPRHLVFNEDGDHLYLIHEMKGEVGFYKKEDNQYQHVATYPLADESFQGDHGGAEIRITTDYEFIYASNRGDANNISVFKREQDGNLNLVQRISSGGETPRNFSLTPGQNYIIAANQGSDNLVLFKRDPNTGRLEVTDQKIEVHQPVYIHFLK